MSVFFTKGESKKRPGIYRRIVNIGKTNIFKASTSGWTPEWDDGLTVLYDQGKKSLKLESGRMTVTYNGIDTVTVKGLSHSHNASAVTIGG